ncbi:MAG: Dph6-related ATP pyrophosphatase [Planctomycetota bacterium]|jgi:uncharacterized protein (TIGR00290 family)
MKNKAIIAWSSGKDAAWALYVARQSGDFEITGILTTVTEDYGRVSMHGVREALLNAQAKSLSLPVYRVGILAECSNEDYENAMGNVMETVKADGVTHVIFGDLFLEGIREYREKKLAQVDMKAVFPLWERDTKELAREMIEEGLRAVITCLDPSQMPRELAGHEYNVELLERLPPEVDPCGENGEFHTFVFDGPMFEFPIGIQTGETVERDGFVFTDVLLEIN